MDGDQTFWRGRCDLKVDESVRNPKFGTVGDLQPKMSCVKTTTFNVKLENFETLACFHQTALVSFCESASEMPFDLSTAREIITLSFWQSPAELSPSTRPSPRSASGSRPLIRKQMVYQVAYTRLKSIHLSNRKRQNRQLTTSDLRVRPAWRSRPWPCWRTPPRPRSHAAASAEGTCKNGCTVKGYV